MSVTRTRPDATAVAVCPRSFSAHARLRELLRERYPNARFNDTGERLHGEALARFLGDAEKAIVGVERIDAGLLARVPRLRVVAKYGVGLDGIDLDALTSADVRLGWRPGVNASAVAEVALFFTIALLRDLHRPATALRAGTWSPSMGRELAESTIGIVGCGHVGRAFVQRLVPFGARVLAHDRVDQPDFYRAHGVTPCGLEELLERSDVVSLHVPLDATTRGILCASRLDRMRSGAFLVNTARGGLVDERHLATLLRQGEVGGAAFDVFAEEPTPDPELLAIPTFLGTPHVAGTSARGVMAMGLAAIESLDDHRPAADHARAR